MKKILATILVAALAGGAWGAATNSVQSANLFGAVKIEGNVASNLYVAVPFEGFEADGAARKAQGVVHPANLAEGTKMYVYDNVADKYDVFEIDSNGAWVAADKVTVNTDGWSTFETADLNRGVTNGTGVIVGRKNTSATVYVYGQVPKIPVTSVTFDEGQTLVSPPYTNGMAAVNLNAFTWSGVAAAESGRLRTTGADYVQFRDGNNNLIRYFWLEGENEGWGLPPVQERKYRELVEDGKALIPAGTAFWYWSKNGGAQVTW